MSPDQLVGAALDYCRRHRLRPRARPGGVFGVFAGANPDAARLEGYLDGLLDGSGAAAGMSGAMFQVISERVCALRRQDP